MGRKLSFSFDFDYVREKKTQNHVVLVVRPNQTYLLYVYVLMKNDIDYYYFISTFRSLAPPGDLKQKGDLFYPHKKKKNPINYMAHSSFATNFILLGVLVFLTHTYLQKFFPM